MEKKKKTHRMINIIIVIIPAQQPIQAYLFGFLAFIILVAHKCQAILNVTICQSNLLGSSFREEFACLSFTRKYVANFGQNVNDKTILVRQTEN